MTPREELKLTHDLNKAIVDLAQANNYTIRHDEKNAKKNILTAVKHVRHWVDQLDG